jgi:hypothetical protein
MWGAEGSGDVSISAPLRVTLEKHPVSRRSLSRRCRKAQYHPQDSALDNREITYTKSSDIQHILVRKWINYAMLLQLQSRKNKLLCPNCTMHLLFQLASSFQ